MAVTKKEVGQFSIFSFLLLVGALLVFPSKLGMDLGSGIFVYAIFEIAYYIAVFALLKAADSWFNLLRNAGLTFIFRLTLGTVFALCISFMYSMNLSVSLTLGVSRYLPAVLMFILFAPFILRNIFISADTPGRIIKPRPIAKTNATDSGVSTLPVANTTVSSSAKPHAATHPAMDNTQDKSDLQVGYDTNGFERAVKYLGEHHAVILATVVDQEGLTMGSYYRNNVDPEDYAPLSLLLDKVNTDLLHKWEGNVSPERFEIVYGDNKLSVSKTSDFYLLVISQQEVDDLLSIRVTQAVDIIRRYVSERYGTLMPSRPEEKYVPSA